MYKVSIFIIQSPTNKYSPHFIFKSYYDLYSLDFNYRWPAGVNLVSVVY